MNDLYDPTQLQALLIVAETQSFTRTAERLGVSQPTVSARIRKLEKATGRQLLARDTHTVALTPDGEAMIGFATTILDAYTPAQRYFAGERPSGRVRLGLSDDLALTRMPQLLRAFRLDNPLIELELSVDQSGQLHRQLERNRLDVFLGKEPLDGATGTLVRRDPMIWVGPVEPVIDPGAPLPLAMYPPPSVTRNLITAALERAHRSYRTACLTNGFNGMVAAVAAGLGISAMAQSMVPPSVIPLGPEHRLPRLGTVDVVLLTNPRTQQRPQVDALIQTILDTGARLLATESDRAHPTE